MKNTKDRFSQGSLLTLITQLMLVTVFGQTSAAQAQSTWVAGATNNTLWSKNLNWSPQVPNSNSAIAIFALPFKPNPSVDLIVTLVKFNSLRLHRRTLSKLTLVKVYRYTGRESLINRLFCKRLLTMGILNFASMATAGTNVSIINNGIVNFVDHSSEGNATITTDSGGKLFLKSGATGASAAVITNGGALTDISQLSGSGNDFWLDCRSWYLLFRIQATHGRQSEYGYHGIRNYRGWRSGWWRRRFAYQNWNRHIDLDCRQYLRRRHDHSGRYSRRGRAQRRSRNIQCGRHRKRSCAGRNPAHLKFGDWQPADN